MDGKGFSTGWKLFPTFDPNAAKNVNNNVYNVSPHCNKVPHIV